MFIRKKEKEQDRSYYLAIDYSHVNAHLSILFSTFSKAHNKAP